MGKRKQYTIAEKLALARKASIPGYSIAFVVHAEGLPQSTVRGFMKNIKKLEENSTSENNLKAIHKDKIPMLTKALFFFERARIVKPPVPITVESVSAKAKILQLNCWKHTKEIRQSWKLMRQRP